jgi:hypothetical protein
LGRDHKVNLVISGLLEAPHDVLLVSNDLLLKLRDHVLLLDDYLLSAVALILKLASHQPEFVLCVH